MIRSALLLALSAAMPLSHAAPDLTTVSERSGFLNTGRYDEVIRLCAGFQQAYPKQVQCIDFGITPEGRWVLAPDDPELLSIRGRELPGVKDGAAIALPRGRHQVVTVLRPRSGGSAHRR